MIYVMVDVEADGPIPGDYSMVQIGAIAITDKNTDPKNFPNFFASLKPISDRFSREALGVIGISREESLSMGDDPKLVMGKFRDWLFDLGDSVHLISDNNGFDAMFINWYFHHFIGMSPFGHSSTNLGSLYKGLVKSVFKNFKHLRVTRHTHHPMDDAMGNVEAFLTMVKKMGLKF